MTEIFRVEEATIGDIHQAFRSGRLSCRSLVEAYLARIAAYDTAGPGINAIVTLNPAALEEADALDRAFAGTGQFTGPLHGIPVLLKDQTETAGITTTFGSITADGYLPAADATIVTRLKAAGALILAKTTMPDFATSWFSTSSLSGETKNPYDVNRDAGGSSSGTGAGVAANFATLGVGEDTGGSIRVPSSFNNLVGVRVTPGLISRAGLSPLVSFQDTAGPMTRTVTDAALLLDSLVGHDPKDPWTAACSVARHQGSYADGLSADGLKGKRIGVVREATGSSDDPSAAAVNTVFDTALEALRSAGAEVVDPVVIPDLAHYIEYTSLYVTHSKHDLNTFLAQRPELSHLSVQAIHQDKRFHEALDLFIAIAGGPDNPEDDPEYFRKYIAREAFQREVVNVMAGHGLDALCFPDVQVLPPTRQELRTGKWTTLTFPTNTLIASQTWMPAISVPAGFTDDGVPVGLELVTPPYDEASLFRLGYALEQATLHRRLPDSTPALGREAGPRP
ncbi:amidase [Streptomyces sp. NPDC059474]|uniref:amidase n=1 Tax=Streptomyces sp. NPDC059474 TaxID=3346846 RepID=UPI0036BF50F7